MIKRYLTIFTCVAVSAVFVANSATYTGSNGATTMTSRFVPDSIGIGDRTALEIDVEQDMMQIVAFPDFDNEGDNPLEMIGEPTIDTLEVSGRRVKLRRKYNFTTFEAGNYNLGRVAILSVDKSGADTLYSADSLLLQVSTFMIDSTSHSIFDVKPIRTLPFQFKEISGYTMWTILALVSLVALIVLFLRLMAYFGRPVMGLFRPAPPVAPHIAAFAALESLRSARLWQEGEYKSYYSGLTDILRTYIMGRYGVSAMEMTSDEIIAASRNLDLPKQCEMEMCDLLRDADLVKFAKAEFDASQNERYFESTRKFVELTKEEDEESEEDVVNEVNDSVTETVSDVESVDEECKN